MRASLQADCDRAEIIALIEEESAAWLRGDVEGWAACWLQDERAQHVNARPSVGARILYGFAAIHDYFAPAVEENLGGALSGDTIRREDWRISISGDMAWATFDQLMPLDASPDHAPGRHNEMRILERIDGEWKIAALFQIPNRIGYYGTPWVRVDRAARIIEMGAGAADLLSHHGSLQIVGKKLCARRRPDNDRLRRALCEADDLVRVRRGRAPVALVLNDDETGSMSVFWITIADMMIVVLLGDERLLTQSIAKAGEAYRLTAAQLRVAEAIARGNDLSRTAALLGVQPNTVRTHVRRMFERVDVNSQAALVTALLSVQAPGP